MRKRLNPVCRQSRPRKRQIDMLLHTNLHRKGRREAERQLSVETSAFTSVLKYSSPAQNPFWILQFNSCGGDIASHVFEDDLADISTGVHCYTCQDDGAHYQDPGVTDTNTTASPSISAATPYPKAFVVPDTSSNNNNVTETSPSEQAKQHTSHTVIPLHATMVSPTN